MHDTPSPALHEVTPASGRVRESRGAGASGGIVPGRVGGVLVTYHPGSDIEEVLIAALNQVDFFVVIDNGSRGEDLGRLKTMVESLQSSLTGYSTSARIQWVANPENVGLSKAYNQGVALCAEGGCEHVLFLDQDSLLRDGAVRTLLAVYLDLTKSARVGALNCRNEEPRITPLDPLSGRMYQRQYVKGALYSHGPVQEIRTVINSGLFMPLSLLRELGGFNEDLFVDAIDNDLSYRLRSKNLRMFRVATAVISHNSLAQTFGSGTFKYRSHGLHRQYFIVRDTVLSVRKWWRTFPVSCTVNFLGMAWGTAMRLVFLPGRRERLRVVVRGCFQDAYPASPSRFQS